MKTVPESIRLDAERAYKASCKRDWTLHAHICRRYPFGTPERQMFEQVQKELYEQNDTGPEYFN